MAFSVEYIPYRSTNAFSTIATDYVESVETLKPFYQHQPNVDGIKDAIRHRNGFGTNRVLLVEQLRQQYAGMEPGNQVTANINSLLLENTYSITTAHQPNIFTGHLYFIYKILHAIKLAKELTQQIPDCNFVPVYYMGSEDADLEELGEVSINGKKYVWETTQKGAVGRMKIDKAFLALADAIEAQISVEQFGKEILSLVKAVYTLNKTIEQATFELVHKLFGEYGLLVLLPDNATLKSAFVPVAKRELLEQFSSKAVATTMHKFPESYKVQAAGRALNLFYLLEDSRERIEKVNDHWQVLNTNVRFTEEQLLSELHDFPERFSPNVILRPVFQELVLPNIAFIGGGGELAYWLELKEVFGAAGVPYPVLVLRNSFMFVNKKVHDNINALQLSVTDFFNPTHILMSELVKRSSLLKLNLQTEREALANIYKEIKTVATNVDFSLERHTTALLATADKKLAELEKKILLAEKKKFAAQERQVVKIKSILCPNDGLQERVDNIIPYYAVHGSNFIELLYTHSTGLQQQFCIIRQVE